MSQRRFSRLAPIAAGVALFALGGCVVAPYYPDDYGYRPYYGAGEVIEVPPPAPRYETVGIAPIAGYVWINGFWGWRGGRHHWVGGHWSAPRAGHSWVSPQWGRAGNGWRLNPGYWRRG
jgi:YXWGXW repeat-containing protein